MRRGEKIQATPCGEGEIRVRVTAIVVTHVGRPKYIKRPRAGKFLEEPGGKRTFNSEKTGRDSYEITAPMPPIDRAVFREKLECIG